MYGKEGLDTMRGMQVGPRLQTPAEVCRRFRDNSVNSELQIRAEYERQRLRVKRSKIENLVKTSHVCSFSSNDLDLYLVPI